jgi:uncharacterized protein (DUF433 family)
MIAQTRTFPCPQLRSYGDRVMIPSTADRITKTPGVCGGRACLRGTRITVWGLVAHRRLGMSDQEILRAVPGLASADLQAAWDYAVANQQEIDRDIRENEDGEAGLAG